MTKAETRELVQAAKAKGKLEQGLCALAAHARLKTPILHPKRFEGCLIVRSVLHELAKEEGTQLPSKSEL